jgi:hypothetical protein
MNIYEKLAEARQDFHMLDISKSGLNKFQGYKYFELADFLIPGMRVMRVQGLVPVVSFGTELATMTIYDVKTDATIVITSPMSTAALKGCHEIQNLGAVQTYLRRYLWVTALEIVEHDALDSSPPVEKPKKRPAQAKATEAQHLLIGDFISTGKVRAVQQVWLKKQGDTLTESHAAEIIKKLQESDK